MNRRRGHGEGTIHHRSDGRWVATEDLGWVNGKRKRKSVYGKTRREVAEKLARIQKDKREGFPLGDDRQDMAQFLTNWLTGAKPTIGPATWMRYEQYVRCHALPAIGSVRLTALSAQHLQELYADRLAAGLSPTTVKHLHRVISRALSQAVRQGLVARNVASLVDPPKTPRHKMQTLSSEQARVLLAAARGDRLEAVYVLALSTGMRQGEILGLRWSDVDLDQQRLQIRGTLQHRDGQLVVGEPKTASSRRQVVLSTTAIDALRRHRSAQAEERLRLGEGWVDSDFVFTNQLGGPIDAGNLRSREFQPLLERAGLPKIRFHDLRHTAATLLLGEGVHPKIVSEMLGHAQVSITLDTYSHATPSMHHEAADVLDRVLGAD